MMLLQMQRLPLESLAVFVALPIVITTLGLSLLNGLENLHVILVLLEFLDAFSLVVAMCSDQRIIIKQLLILGIALLLLHSRHCVAGKLATGRLVGLVHEFLHGQVEHYVV